MYFTVSLGRKFWDLSWCPLNTGCLLDTGVTVVLIMIIIIAIIYNVGRQVKSAKDRAYPGFSSMKQLEVFLLPSSPSREVWWPHGYMYMCSALVSRGE